MGPRVTKTAARAVTICAAVALLALPATSQDALSAIVERGYVAHWLVCGPFASDIEGGISGALRRAAPALGSSDFMEPVGGIARLRPEHLMRVRTDDGEAIWQRAGVRGPALDLGPFFPDASEGVAFAGFYAQADAEQDVLLELQTHLGARVFLNGSRVREIAPAAFPAGGVAVFPVTVPAGLSFLVFEVPGLRHAELAEFLGTSEATIKERHLSSRPLLTGASGFEFALALRPLAMLDELAYVPTLDVSGAMARDGGAVRPLGVLTLYNNGAEPSAPVQVVARAGSESTSEVAPPIAPGQSRRVEVPLPRTDGAIEVELTLGERTARFTAVGGDAPAGVAGTVHFISGVYRPDSGDALPREAVDAYGDTLRGHLQLLDDPAYGFDLGPARLWSAELLSNAAARPMLQKALISLQTSPHLEMAGLDERLVGDEVLARNLLYGHHAAEGLLNTPGHVLYAWRLPALAPQTPQLVASAGGMGIVSSLETSGLTPLFSHVALDGDAVLHRRKQPGLGPSSLEELRSMAETQRQELLAAGITADLIVNESVSPPPEPFMLGAAATMADWVPSVKLSSVGAEDFFRSVNEGLARRDFEAGPQASLLTRVRLGELVAQPSLKAAYGETERLVGMAERAATAAGLLGAAYPSRTMDLAWRQLIALGTPDRLGYAETDVAKAELLAGCREAAAVARDVLDGSLAYLGGEIDTFSSAPVRDEHARAVVVFNPSPWTRTDVCVVHVDGLGAPSFSLVDDARATVACEVTKEQMPPGAPERLSGRFVARDVPGFGWRTYYAIPQRERVEPLATDSMQIENEFYWVTVGPESGGAITSVVDKRTGRELSGGLWNDVLLLGEGDTRGGHDLWTTGALERASGNAAEIRVTKHAAVQTIRVVSKLGGGDIARVLRVYPGLPRIDCEIEVSGVDLGSSLLAMSSDVDPAGRAVVVGERLGAVVGRKSSGSLDFRTRGTENVSASGLQPALRWAAMGAGDSIDSGLNAVAPMEIATIVVDSAGTMDDAADALLRALAQRGVPCGITRDVAAVRNPKWSDATTFNNPNEDARSGCGMRIVLGGPEQNVFAKQVLMQAPESAMAAFNGRLAAGVCMYVEDAYVSEGLTPVPTVVIGGGTAGAVAQQAQRLAQELRDKGHMQIPRDLYVARSLQEPTEDGVAVFHPGAFLFSAEADGSMVVPVAHDDDGSAALRRRYAFYPFTGRWQGAGLGRSAQGFAEPFQCVVTDLHVGRQRPNMGLLSLEGDPVGVSAVKPAETPEASFSYRETRPLSGVMLRLFETSGSTAMVELASFAPLRGAFESDVVERLNDPIDVDVNRASLMLSPFRVTSVVVEPSTRVPQGERRNLESALLEIGPHPSRFWRQNRWVSTAGIMPVGIALDGRADEASTTVQLHITNNTSDAPVRGTVRLTAPDDWHLSTSEVAFDVPARGGAVETITVMRKYLERAAGGIVASVDVGDQTYYDVLQLDPAPCSVETETSGNRLEVLVRNTGAMAVMARVEAIVSPEYWPELHPLSDAQVTPRLQTATIPTEGEQRFVVRTRGVSSGVPITVKVAANGTVQYTTVTTP